MYRACVLIAGLALGTGCANDDLGEIFGDLTVCASIEGEVCTAPLELGALRFGETHSVELGVRNDGTGVLRITSVTAGSGDVTIEDHPNEVAPREVEPLTLAVTPVMGAGEATLVFESNDPNPPQLEVVVTYEGVAPVLVVCPPDDVAATPASCSDTLEIDIGEVAPTRSFDVPLLVRNAGTSTLVIAGVDVLDESSRPEEEEFAILTSTSAGRLEAGEDSTMLVRYRPSDGIEDRYTITITPDDTTTTPVTVTLLATTPPNNPPVADAFEVVSGSAIATGEVGLAVWFDGRASSDPEGDPLQFSWSVVAAPFGSSVQPETPDAQTTRFVPDLLGAYTVQLQVADSLGLVAFTDVALTIEPRYEATVLLSWGTAAGDADLHLVPTGDALFGSTDCFFDHTDVDLGVAGDSTDNAVLEADDESGSGEERISIRRPADGDYDVYVHYFDSRGGLSADISVQLFTDDESSSIGSATVTLDADCQLWRAGTLQWPAGGFLPASDPITTQCYTP